MAEQNNMECDSYLEVDDAFLKNLPPSIRRYTYQGEQQFFDILKSESALFEASSTGSEFILFHASKETIETLFNPPNEESPISKLCTSFDTIEQLFLITMPSNPHSAAVDAFSTVIKDSLTSMGLSFSLQGYPNATTRGVSRGKQPDYGWGPKRRARGEPDSPSVTLEVAYSESDSKLNSDVRFWLNPNEGKAKLCLTLQIHKSRPEIRIEKWERQQDRKYRSQVTYITKNGDHFNVIHHPFTIPFESLFGRQPTCPREKDIEFSQGQLGEIADMIWESQGW
ncbi:uncharacterized protein N7479_010289 [Penicillium vulpinum]|uniref:Uncharacterized protein n=1 Tax=Penicillium vulpinum TaxID=29845 RepID=A0A1V6S9K1_9EURO|nr:uncharacterized protein N7479_010289 [Penicillium vulpinum]KAJ5951876.1 hypothetical protein N7479_010289 [Penicillium vulpinum]OQE10419.1 hypothetical protein PENVUL_c004G03863 [Penicillium vulpinum]